MSERITFHVKLSPAAERAERKMHRAARFLDLPVGSRRWRRWNRVVARNIARLEREVETECRQVGHFVDEREPRWAPGLVRHHTTFDFEVELPAPPAAPSSFVIRHSSF